MDGQWFFILQSEYQLKQKYISRSRIEYFQTYDYKYVV